MQKLILTILASAWLFGVGSFTPERAHAIPLNVDLDPVPFDGMLSKSKSISGEVDILSIESDRLELRIFVDKKTFGRIGVLAVNPDSSTIAFTDAGPVDAKSGVKFAFGLDDEAIFSLSENFNSEDPKASDPFFVEFGGEALGIGDTILFRLFDGGGKGGFKKGNVIVSTSIIPEPSAALLLGLGLGGLALVSRRSAVRRRAAEPEGGPQGRAASLSRLRAARLLSSASRPPGRNAR